MSLMPFSHYVAAAASGPNIDSFSSTPNYKADISSQLGSSGFCYIALKPDDSRLIVYSTASDDLFSYTLSTSGDLSSLSYDSKTYAPTTSVNYTAFCISFDGTKLYLCSTTETVEQHDLSTAWDLSTASYASKSFSFSGKGRASNGLAVSPDGDKFYFGEISGTDTIHQYSITSGDISTASDDSKSIDISEGGGQLRGFAFHSSGRTLYAVVSGTSSDENTYIYQYDLSTPWDVSTGSYSSRFLAATGAFSQDQGGGVALYSDGSGVLLGVFDDGTANAIEVWEYT